MPYFWKINPPPPPKKKLNLRILLNFEHIIKMRASETPVTTEDLNLESRVPTYTVLGKVEIAAFAAKLWGNTGNYIVKKIGKPWNLGCSTIDVSNLLNKN